MMTVVWNDGNGAHARTMEGASPTEAAENYLDRIAKVGEYRMEKIFAPEPYWAVYGGNDQWRGTIWVVRD